jgi:transcription termination/antitermination protein NusG
MFQDCEGRWFAIQVRPNAENTALVGLRSKGYEAYLPTYCCSRQWSDRVKKVRLPLFAGYLFCKFSFAATAPIVTTLGVVRILGVGDTPVPVADSEIASLQAIEAATGVRSYPWPKMEVGGRVRIGVGPLRGLAGVLQSVKGETTLIVSVSLLHRAVAVEIPEDWIVPSEASALPNAISGSGVRISRRERTGT